MSPIEKNQGAILRYMFIWLAWFIILEGLGYLMGAITASNLYPWYANLVKSHLTPPNIAFAVVWPALYALLATAGCYIFIKKNYASHAIKYLFSAQLLLNFLWTPIFFGLHRVGAALSILCLMVVLTLILIIQLYKKNKMLSILLLPYLAWITFAMYLNAVIWMH